MAAFRDHFSRESAAYAAHRPRYPDTLLAALASAAPGRALAWDAGTGSGQAAVGLAAHFDRVFATDASAGQIAAAEPHPRVEYRVAPAEASGLPAGSCDLVTAAQALHWFDVDRFLAEAARALRPGGVLAVWTYALLLTGDPALDAALDAFAHETVGPWWPPERALVDAGYAGIALPFPELPLAPFTMAADLSPDDLAAYLGTWSAVRRHADAVGADPVPPFVDGLRARWGARRPVTWPLTVRAARKPAAR